MKRAALLLTATLLVAACGEKPAEKKGAPPTLITTTLAKTVALEVSERTLGSLEAVDDPKIGAEIAGKIVKIAVRAGEAVSKGQLLAQIDPTDAGHQATADNAESARLQALLAQQERVLARQTELVQQAPEQAAPAPVGGSLLGIAASYVGYPYVLYGTPPQAFDCSAYTWWVFKQAGIDIPRTVAGQKAAVTPVSDPQPGDLVFYNDWYHVGIYAGNGMTYEALNPSTDVRYGPLLSNNVWYGRLG